MATHELLPPLVDWERIDDFSQARLRWLVKLRWFAMAGVLIAAITASMGLFPGVAWSVLYGVAACGITYNFLLMRAQGERGSPVGRAAALHQAVVDLGMLTAVLWCAGGITSPFLGYYVFHVALIAILAGPRAAVVAALAALVGAGFLSLAAFVPELHVTPWNPPAPWDAVADVVAFTTMLGGITYIIAHAANDLREREAALRRARDRVALDYELLTTTLDELDAGLEVIDGKGIVLFSNKRAEAIGNATVVHEGATKGCAVGRHGCEQDVTGVCPVRVAMEDGQAGRCRFAMTMDGSERVYEMLTFPLESPDKTAPRLMNLYVDRTQATIGERKLMLAERLASLGRIAQGVAHELNTPLATIRTLATDMGEALTELEASDDGTARARIVSDLRESATLVREETKRLGRITHELLAGGDLVRARVPVDVAVGHVVERARALVVAGAKDHVTVRVDASVTEVRSRVDADRLMQILVNLLQNALDSIRNGGGSTVVVRAEARGGRYMLFVEDDGPGLADDIKGRIFEPFATTKPVGEGTGLGLYTSYMLARGMGAELALDDHLPRGASASLFLPA